MKLLDVCAQIAKPRCHAPSQAFNCAPVKVDYGCWVCPKAYVLIYLMISCMHIDCSEGHLAYV